MEQIIKYLRQLKAICPEAEATIHCLSFAIKDEINGWKDIVEELSRKRVDDIDLNDEDEMTQDWDIFHIKHPTVSKEVWDNYQKKFQEM